MSRNSHSTWTALSSAAACAGPIVRAVHFGFALGSLLLVAGCERDMADQPRYEPFEASNFFENGMASRPLVPGTVARGHLELNQYFLTGKVDGKPGTEFPEPVTAEMLKRGKERYNIYCSQCHGQLGYGQGMVVRRGFPRPPSYHIERLRDAPAGHFFDVISNGFGRMPSHAYLVPTADRWAIVAYIRALQLSQHAEKTQLEPADIKALDAADSNAAGQGPGGEPGPAKAKSKSATTPEA